jgi:putative restriction endonuclease
MRQELEQYRNQHGETAVTLHEIYDFSEQRLSSQFPDNNHVRAKIRQQLQRLRDRDEVEFLDEQGTYRIGVSDGTQHEKTELEEALTSEPQLTDDEEQFTESRRRARDAAFTQPVRDAYNKQCAICGSKRESPDGDPEVEAAHIYPKSENGSDDIRNGIALCKLHHWAFDSGWLSLTDNHEIIVKEAPDQNGYHSFKQLEGRQIQLPNKQEAHPHPMFIKEHRRIHGFTST